MFRLGRQELEKILRRLPIGLIAEKVAVASDAQRDYAALLAERQSALMRKQLTLETDQVDVDYVGKPQELLRTFAARYGYRYVESGKRTTLRTINIRVEKLSPLEVLRNIGYQTDVTADIMLDQKDKILRLIYKSDPLRERR